MISFMRLYKNCTLAAICPWFSLWPCPTSLSSCSSVSLPTAIQLQLHANKSLVLQRRKGGTPNWIDCKSVHQAGSESIMQRNGFWETECPHWVRGAFCLQQPRPACVCILRQVNHESQNPVLHRWHLFLWCSLRSTSENLPLVCILECDRMAWMLFPLPTDLHSHLCVMYSGI